MTNQPDHSSQPDPVPGSQPDPAAPPPFTPDGTAAGGAPADDIPAAPRPPSYTPGQAPIPKPGDPPTAAFPAQPWPTEPWRGAPGNTQPMPGLPPQGPPGPDPNPSAVNYAPPGYAPDYGHGQPGAGYGEPAPGYGHPGAGYGEPAPGYGHPGPGYGQPAQGYGTPGPDFGAPPGSAPRRSNAPLIAVILAVGLLLCGGVATAGVLIFQNVKEKAQEATAPFDQLPTAVPELPNLPSTVPDLPEGSGHKITVTYEVTGDGPATILYVEKLGSAAVRLDDVQLPWKFTAEVETPTLLSVTAMRVDTSAGSITCRALVDGDEVKRNESGQSNFATASCTSFALD